MKKLISFGCAVLFSILIAHASSVSAADSFPNFPMTVWGTAMDGSRELPTGTTISYFNASGTPLTQYSLVSNGVYWSNGPSAESPTLQQFDGALTIKVAYLGKTYVLTEKNIRTSTATAWCPAPSSITFVSKVCRYDIDLSNVISPETLTGTVSHTGSVDFSTGSSSPGPVFSQTGSIIVTSPDSASNVVVLNTRPSGSISASWSWDWVFRAPAVISASGSTPEITGYTRVSSLNYEIGSDLASLTLSGMTAMIRIDVWTVYNGKTLKIFRSSDKQTSFVFLADCIVASGICEFATDKFSVFALAAPASSSSWTTGWATGWSTSGASSGASGGSTGTSVSTPASSTVSSTWSVATSSGIVVPESPKVDETDSVSVPKSFTGIFDPGFQDARESFAKNEIGYLVFKGIISGYSDKTFQPNNRATRAEFLKIAMKGAGYSIPAKASNNPFSDTDVNWQAALAQKARESGIISGQTVNGKLIFRPNDPITRAEAMKILFNAMKLKSWSASKTAFSDVGESWMVPYLESARESGIISGQTVDGKLVFRPNDPITRAEVAKVVVRGMFAQE